MPAWPNDPGLGQTLLMAGYEEQPPDNLAESDVDQGPPITRRRFTGGHDPIGGTVKATKAGVEVFRVFYRDDLGDGALAFDWLHPRTQQAASVKIRKGSVRITQVSRAPMGWRIAMTLLVRET